ncbi:MAG TPA: hypothetical protein VIU64_11535, partial [Polyangia bacterium]
MASSDEDRGKPGSRGAPGKARPSDASPSSEPSFERSREPEPGPGTPDGELGGPLPFVDDSEWETELEAWDLALPIGAEIGDDAVPEVEDPFLHTPVTLVAKEDTKGTPSSLVEDAIPLAFDDGNAPSSGSYVALITSESDAPAEARPGREPGSPAPAEPPFSAPAPVPIAVPGPLARTPVRTMPPPAAASPTPARPLPSLQARPRPAPGASERARPAASRPAAPVAPPPGARARPGG